MKFFLRQMVTMIIVTVVSLCPMENISFAADQHIGNQLDYRSLDRLTLVCHGLATLDVRDFTNRADTDLVAAKIVPGKMNGWMILDANRPFVQGGNARQFNGTIHVDYATHAAWIGNTCHYSFAIPATAISISHIPDFNDPNLTIGGETVYTVTGNSPVFQEMPDSYLIPNGYQKFLPEAITFCQSNSKQLRSSQSERGMLTALLESPDPFLKLMAVRGLSEDPIAMNNSTAPTRMITDALSAHGDLQAALVAIILGEGGKNADELMAAIMTKRLYRKVIAALTFAPSRLSLQFG